MEKISVVLFAGTDILELLVLTGCYGILEHNSMYIIFIVLF